jgi:hypothetical protein
MCMTWELSNLSYIKKQGKILPPTRAERIAKKPEWWQPYIPPSTSKTLYCLICCLKQFFDWRDDKHNFAFLLPVRDKKLHERPLLRTDKDFLISDKGEYTFFVILDRLWAQGSQYFLSGCLYGKLAQEANDTSTIISTI